MTETDIKLLHGYLDGALSEADMATLEDVLRSDPEARRMLRSLATIDAKWQEVAAAEAIPQRSQAEGAVAPPRPALPLWAVIGSIAAALVIGVSGWFFRPDPIIASAPDRGLARIIRAEGTTTANGKAVEAGSELYSGDKLVLAEGIIELAFRDSGVHVIATGPFDATLDTTKRMYLRTGSAKLVVPPQGQGFVVDTYERKITDLGTSFVVTASEKGSDVLVLDGFIRVEDREQESEHMYKGDVARFDREGHAKIRSVHSSVPEVPISNVPITTRSLTGVLVGLQGVPSVKGGKDLIGAQVLPWVQSVFHDETSLAGFHRTEQIRFSGIGGSYDTFVERNGFEPFAETRGWLAWYSGKVTPPKPGRYRFWGYADNHLVVGIDDKLVFEGGRYDSTFRREKLVPRKAHPAYPCLTAQVGFASGPWVELDGSPISLNVLFGEIASTITSGILLVEREGEAYDETTWGQPKWPLLLTETPTLEERAEWFKLQEHMEDRMRGSFSIPDSDVWQVVE
jgi:hypothetical protein